MSATPYIEALSKETGMDITLSASGAATLSLGGRNLLIQWIEATNSFIVYVEVGALGGWRNGEICRLLLASNFLLADTQGGALSYNDATGMVGLNFPIPVYGLDTGDFLKAVNNVILFSETWKTRLDAMNKEQEELTEKAQQAVLDGGMGMPRNRLSQPRNSSASRRNAPKPGNPARRMRRTFNSSPSHAGQQYAPYGGAASAENGAGDGRLRAPSRHLLGARLPDAHCRDGLYWIF